MGKAKTAKKAAKPAAKKAKSPKKAKPAAKKTAKPAAKKAVKKSPKKAAKKAAPKKKAPSQARGTLDVRSLKNTPHLYWFCLARHSSPFLSLGQNFLALTERAAQQTRTRR